MKRIVTLYDPLYCVNFLLLWGLSKPEFDKYVYKKFGISDEGLFQCSGVYFSAQNKERGDYEVIAMKDVFDGSPYMHALLAHECLHATFAILRDRGVTYSGKSEEAFTYYLGWMISELAERMTQVELKLALKK